MSKSSLDEIPQTPPILDADALEKLIVGNDLSALTPPQRIAYVLQRCKALGLDPAERPFALLRLDGRLVMYAQKACTDALARNHHLSRTIVNERERGDVLIMTARAETPEGRADEAVGAVPLVRERVTKWGKSRNGKSYPEETEAVPMTPSEIANAYMKAETKAKRRAVLSLCGLGGVLDESELDTVRARGDEAIEIEQIQRDAKERDDAQASLPIP